MKKNILITGGSGFLGRHLIAQAVDDWNVTAIHRRPVPEILGCQWIAADLTNMDQLKAVLDRVQPDAIIHAAAMARLDEAEANRDAALAINYTVTRHIAQWCADHACRLVFVSTDQVFDGNYPNATESDPAVPLNYYGETKLQAEKAVLDIQSNSVVARAALIYGFSLGGQRTFFENTLIRLQEKKPVRLFEDEFRTPILVNNLAAALLELAGHSYCGRIHLAGNERLSRYKFGELMAEVMDLPKVGLQPGKMADIDFPAQRPADCSMANSLAARILDTKLLSCRDAFEWLNTHAIF
ncbi:SDR family oxidoreductase [bacterium]|nr:SDR family oxidoreductase [bacterium]